MNTLRYIILFALSLGVGVEGYAGTLKEVYQGDFLIGTALGSRHAKGHPQYIYPMRQDKRELEIAAREFNCVTAENLMKWQYLQPRKGEFNFEQADELVAFAEKNNQAVVGHALVWHNMLPDWVFKDSNGETVSREVLIERMRNHIYTVVGRYKGRIQYWDVVNEAVVVRRGGPDKQKTGTYRKSPWFEIIGEEYIELAFRFAHEADPAAHLIYNDYSMNRREKVEFVAEMVRKLKAKGVPIHGVGFQGHWHLNYPSMKDLESAISLISATGVKLHISELEIGILPPANDLQGADIERSGELNAALNPYTQSVPPEKLKKQAQKYSEVFKLLLRNRDLVERVTLWGVTDQYSWINNWPVEGRTAHPLLFDRNYQPKPAYQALKALKELKK